MGLETVAIVGVGCRFPGGGDGPAAFWDLLCRGVDGIREVPPDRWNAAAFYDPRTGRPGRTYTKWAGFVDGIDRFDPGFFGISPREADFMDPQQRLLLMMTWEALEDAGLRWDQVWSSPTGVFVGISTNDYSMMQTDSYGASVAEIYSTTGSAVSIASNRISYCLNLRGPSMSIDTACSSSLIALHAARESLLAGDCTTAIVGGVNALLGPAPFVAFSRMGMLSPDGRCMAFDSRANGFVRGEGCGVVILKRLSQALADGDAIYAVIRATAANQDGRTNGITVPCPRAQEALTREACRRAGLPPRAIRYAEAHGTGTFVGDPIEAHALGSALGDDRPSDDPCLVGSVKTNIGHLEAGAGIAGTIKLALMLRHGQIPPNLHFLNPNPHIDFEALRLRVPTELQPFRTYRDEPPAACINSFGFGGANAHAVLQAWHSPRAAGRRGRRSPSGATNAKDRLLVLSARTAEALAPLALRYADALHERARGNPGQLDLVCAAAAHRRGHHPHRLAIVGDSPEEIAARLRSHAAGEDPEGTTAGEALAPADSLPVFVFSGQGPQWWGMGRELFAEEPVFREQIEACDTLIRSFGGWSLVEELHRDEKTSRIAETAIAQPAIFAIQVALAALWRSWGVQPAACVGHSVGEVAAAHIAGALDLTEATRVIFERGRCMDLTTERGRMLAASLTHEDALDLIAPFAGKICVGAVNGPASVTLSGEGDALERIAAQLDARGLFNRFLQVNYAFHSHQMDPIRGELLKSLSGIEARSPSLPLFSTVTATETTDGDFGDAYWWRNVREPVLFAKTIGLLIDAGHRHFLELAPHPVLAGSIRECLAAKAQRGHIVSSLRRKEPERRTLLAALGTLFAGGGRVDWSALYPEAPSDVSLPRYPWQLERHWHESLESAQTRLSRPPHPWLRRELPTARRTWLSWFELESHPFLRDHRVGENIVFPAAAYIDTALGAVSATDGQGTPVLEDVDIQKALFIPDGDERIGLQFSMAPCGTFTISSRIGVDSEEPWAQHVAGTGRRDPHIESPAPIDIKALRASLPETYAPERLYQMYVACGLNFGPSFRVAREIYRAPRRALARVSLDESCIGDADRHVFHPALLDGCLQAQAAAAQAADPNAHARLFLPVRADRVRLYGCPGRAAWSYARLTAYSTRSIAGDITVFDEGGRVLMEIHGFRSQALTQAARASHDDPAHWTFEARWEPKPVADPAPTDPSPLAPHTRIHAKAQAALRRLNGDGGNPAQAAIGFNADCDRLAILYIIRAWQALGWRPRKGASFQPGALERDLGIAPRHHRLFQRCLGHLVAARILRRTRDGYAVSAKPPTGSHEIAWKSLFDRAPECLAELSLLRRCGLRLAEILRGEADPVAVLFGEPALLEQFYQDSPSFRTINASMAEAIQAAIAGLPPGRKARILEIGGGTGGMTAHILSRLDPSAIEYTFSDVSAAFFPRAEQKFFEYKFVQYKPLDIERPATGQGFSPSTFDIIVASDVIHAVRDIRAALRHAQELLRPGGLIAFIENEHVPAWCDLIFGLTDGWWRFEDLDLRPDYPLLARQGWARALQESGLGTARFVGEETAQNPSGHLIVLGAKSPQASECLAIPQTEANPTTAPEDWWIIADRTGIAPQLADTLTALGHTCRVIGESAAPPKPARRIARAAITRSEFDGIIAEAGLPQRIVFCRALDAPAPKQLIAADLADAERHACHSLMHLVQAITAAEPKTWPQLSILTRGAQPAGDEDAPRAVAQCPVIGLGRVIQAEARNLRARLIDLDPTRETGVDALVACILANDREDEAAIRGSTRWVSRIHPATPATLASRPRRQTTKTAFRLEAPAPGTLDKLTYLEIPRRRPAAGEVAFEIHAAALNFRDVMKALGIYPVESDIDLLLGDEAAGRITAVGKGVNHLKPGDPVLAIGPGSFASHAVLPADAVLPMPRGLSFEHAVTVPVTFLTAWYALHECARIRPGDRVLIHAGTGGVGLAALQIALLAGARPIATAGTPEKRDLLRAIGIGHVFDSRSVAFVDQIRDLTEGAGVDVILNSLAGQAIPRGMSLLAPHGRFLEIGKRDVYQDSRVGLRALRNNASMHVIDLSQVMRDRRDIISRMWASLRSHFEAGRLHPLPHRVYPADRAIAAFQEMAQGRHIGKIVLGLSGARIRPEPRVNPILRTDPRGAYLVTGGLSGFGLSAAQWLADRGARHLVLVSRRGAASPEAQAAVENFQARGIRVTVAKADVADPSAIADIMAGLRRARTPLRGVVHSAMVLDDGVLTSLDAHRFERVMSPKTLGAWNLHEATLRAKLDFFVLFSSASALMGNPGQANYAAANSFLDGLAEYRRALGLPATSINWGQIAEVGFVARNEQVEHHLNRQGLYGVPPLLGFYLLEQILNADASRAAILRIDWQKWRGSSLMPDSPRMSPVIQAAAAGAEGGAGSVREEILAAPALERLAVTAARLTEQIAKVLRTTAARLDPTRPLSQLGLDSLMAVELMNRIDTAFEVSLPPGRVNASATIQVLAAILVEAITGEPPPADSSLTLARSTPVATAPAPTAADSIVVELRPGDALQPLFCIFPAGGSAEIYRTMADALPPGRAVYGIQSRVFAGADDECRTPEELASTIADAICAKQPAGPVHLFGFSAGGFFAHAVAGELEARARVVAFLGMADSNPLWLDAARDRSTMLESIMREVLDTFSTVFPVLVPSAARRLEAELPGLLPRLVDASDDDRTSIIFEWLRDSGGLESRLPEPVVRGYITLFNAHTRLIQALRPRAISAPMTAWLSSVKPTAEVESALASLTRGPVGIASVSAGHYDLMCLPAAGVLAGQLADALAPPREATLSA